jgi:hypothetical protein
VDDGELDLLIARADLDGLIRLIDARSTTRDWEGLLRVRNRSRAALDTGRQIWPAATLAEHRLALLADPQHAALVLDEDSGRFAIGPLTEVVAQNHTWADLSPHLPTGPRRAFVAYERALRGEIVLDDVFPVLDIPIVPDDWEPEYTLPRYHDVGVECPSPADRWTHEWNTVSTDDGWSPVDDPWITDAFRALVEPWTAKSNGRAESVIVEGGPEAVLDALGLASARLAPLDAGDALDWLVWCGASGGAHGRRRGSASGRFSAWWLLAALGGITEDWDDLRDSGDLASELSSVLLESTWWRFDDGSGSSAYELSLVVEVAENDESATPLGVALLARDHPG